jgi:hypothetical protein
MGDGGPRRAAQVTPGRVAPFPNPLIVWCHGASLRLIFGSRVWHCAVTLAGQRPCSAPSPPGAEGGTPRDAVGGRVRLRAVTPGRVVPLPHPLTVWCHEDSLLFGSRARHCTGPGQHKCAPLPTHRERSEPGTSWCRSRYAIARAVRPGPGPWTRHGGHLLITRACDARALRSWLVSPYAPRGRALTLSLWPSAQAYASRCSLPNRLARSRRG